MFRRGRIRHQIRSDDLTATLWPLRKETESLFCDPW